jgi:DNA-binding transcriptional regulator/RsmH inhibitor MraZ
MANLLVVGGVDTTNVANPARIFAPVEQTLKVKSALIVAGPTTHFELWQDVSYYFFVDSETATISQRPGADFADTQILCLLEV